MTLTLGYDQSDMQGTMTAAHYVQLKARGVEFVIFRVGIGNDGIDGHFRTEVPLAKAAGLSVGLYQFPYIIPVVPGHESRSPETQADAHWSACAGIANTPGVDIITFSDLEWPDPDSRARWGVTDGFTEDFIGRYKSRYVANSGRRMGSYTYPYWAKGTNLASLSSDVLGDLWQAGPYVQTMPTALPLPIAPWSSVSLCQWTGGKGGGVLPNGSLVDWDCTTPENLAALIQ